MIGLQRATLFEGTTLILLFGVAMPLKYFAGVDVATSVMGPIHGLGFVVFTWFVVRAWAEELIGFPGVARLVAGAFIPGASFLNERWLRRIAAENRAAHAV